MIRWSVHLCRHPIRGVDTLMCGELHVQRPYMFLFPPLGRGGALHAAVGPARLVASRGSGAKAQLEVESDCSRTQQSVTIKAWNYAHGSCRCRDLLGNVRDPHFR